MCFGVTCGTSGCRRLDRSGDGGVRFVYVVVGADLRVFPSRTSRRLSVSFTASASFRSCRSDSTCSVRLSMMTSRERMSRFKSSICDVRSGSGVVGGPEAFRNAAFSRIRCSTAICKIINA